MDRTTPGLIIAKMASTRKKSDIDFILKESKN